ncbi:MAG: hypothetical protein V4617_07635 [Gemmatimonadota bacterium]
MTQSVEGSFDVLALRVDFGGLPAGTDRGPADTWSAALVDHLEVQVTFTPAGHPDEHFEARLVWDRYPDAPPSVLFRDPATGRLDVATAWPVGGPFRPMVGLCVNYTREGFRLHPEWVGDPRLRWRTEGNVLLKVIRLMQDSFDTEYTGRHP